MSFSAVEPAGAVSPDATRANARRLRDPRLWVGVLLVALSATVGGRVLASAEDTVRLWSAARDLRVGAQLVDADLVGTSVHFADASSAGSYLSVGAALVGRRLEQPVRAGELIPSSAIGGEASPVSELPVGVAAADLPSDLVAGDRVDLWVLPIEGSGDLVRVLRDVWVAAVSEPQIAAVGGDREVVLAVESTSDVAAALRRLAGGRVVLVRVGG